MKAKGCSPRTTGLTEKQKSMKERILNLLWMEKKYRDPEYSQQQLAADLGISVFTLSRNLQQVFGLRYMELVHRWRIQDAMRHLRNQRKQQYTVDNIGVLVGFKNRQSFFSAFKKEAGTTPELYRQTERKQPSAMRHTAPPPSSRN